MCSVTLFTTKRQTSSSASFVRWEIVVVEVVLRLPVVGDSAGRSPLRPPKTKHPAAHKQELMSPDLDLRDHAYEKHVEPDTHLFHS